MLDALYKVPVQGLLFDLDGTLVDSVPDLTAAVDAMLTQLDLPTAGVERVRHWVGNGSKVLVHRALSNVQNISENALDPLYLDAAHTLFLDNYQRLNGVASRLYPGVYEALTHWYEEHMKMAIVTNKPARFVPSLLQQLNIAEFFAVTVGGDTVSEKKPAPLPLLYACRELGIAPESAIMIGDSRTDINAARAVPMPVVCVSYGYNHGEPVTDAGPDVVIDSLLEMVNLRH